MVYSDLFRIHPKPYFIDLRGTINPKPEPGRAPFALHLAAQFGVNASRFLGKSKVLHWVAVEGLKNQVTILG